MKAVIARELSPNFSAVELADVPAPICGADEVRLRIRAAALGFPDLLMTQGLYQHKPELPFIPGGEVAGEIMECGKNVKDWREGDKVVAAKLDGGLAEQGVYPAAALRALPANLDYAHAAAVQSAYLTAYVGLVRRAALQKDEWLLVLGAGGGVGLAAVDLAGHLGARVIAAASNDAKLATIQKHYRPDFCINTNEGFREQVKTITDGGADVIYDPVGGDAFDESVRCIAWGGRLLVIGFASGRIANIGANMPLIKGFSVVGVRAGEYGRRDPKGGAENLEAIWQLAAAGKIRPHVHTRLNLTDWREGFRLMQTRELVGRVVIEA